MPPPHTSQTLGLQACEACLTFLRVIPVCNNEHGTYLSQNSLLQNRPFFLFPPTLSFPSSLCPSFSFSFSPFLPLSFSVTWGLLPAYFRPTSWPLLIAVPFCSCGPFSWDAGCGQRTEHEVKQWRKQGFKEATVKC